MGRKRTQQGKQIYFYLATLILLGLAGCAFFREFQERQDSRESLQLGRRLFAQGDYEGALRENQKVASLSTNRPPADEAVYHMGLIYAHVENPKRDYRRALGFFRKLIHDYPQSAFVEEAKVWVGVFLMNEKLSQMMEKSKQVDIEIEERRRDKER